MANIEITEAGLELPADAVLSVDLLSKAFHPAQVEAKTTSAEGESYTVFTVSQFGDVLMTIEPNAEGKLASFQVVARGIEGPKNLAVGMSFEEVVEGEKVSCYRGAEVFSDLAICSLDSLPQFNFMVDLAGVDTGDCVTACPIEEDQVKALKDREIQRFGFVGLE